MVRLGSMMRVISCVLISLSLWAGGASAATEEERRKIVIALDGISLSLLQPIILATGSEIVFTLTLINAYAIRLPDLSLNELEAIVQSLLSNPLVAGVYNDIVGSAAEVTPVTQAEILADASSDTVPWGVKQIGATEVQQTGSNGAGVTVAVLDTGIDCEHSELHDNIVSFKGFSAFSGEDPCNDDHGHGTHIAGTIAARLNQQGIIGVAPNAQLVPVKVLNHNAQAFCSDVIAGLQWVHSKGIRVANMSFGFSTHSVPLKKAIERLNKKGIIMVASAGNCGWGDEGGDGGDGGEPPSGICDDSSPDNFKMMYPAVYPEVIAVAASTIEGKVAYYSRIGPVGVTAPGGTKASEPILSTAPDEGYALKSGTSMAAAHVSAAVMLALQREPKLSPTQVRSLLQSTAVVLIDPSTGQPYPQDQQGGGEIDVIEMLQALQ